MAWLSDWAKRIEITVDNGNIDSDLTHFPVPIILGTSVGQDSDDVSAIFDEVGANWQKIAVTKSDGTTEIYVEKEQWDDGDEKAVLWVSKSDLTLSSSSETTLYLYYDSSHADNTTYVADVGSRTEVWDGNFKAVWHLGESSGDAIDSTSNSNDGSFEGNLPTPADGQIGKGQDFNGTSDWIDIPNNFGIFDGNSDFTVQALINANSVPASDDYQNAPIVISFRGENVLMITYDDGGSNPDRLSVRVNLDDGGYTTLVESTRQSTSTDYCHAFTFNTSTGWVWYENGSSQDTNDNTGTIEGDSDNSKIGYHDNNRYFDGVLDELRISDTTRSAAWIKADYHAQTDDLLSYGSEEIPSTFIPQVIIT